jgi:hypothetical protein
MQRQRSQSEKMKKKAQRSENPKQISGYNNEQVARAAAEVVVSQQNGGNLLTRGTS